MIHRSQKDKISHFVCIEHDISVICTMIEIYIMKKCSHNDEKENPKMITIMYEKEKIYIDEKIFNFNEVNNYVKSLVLNLVGKINWKK